MLKEVVTGALTASPNAVTFGDVSIGQTASTPVSLLNRGSGPVEITQFNLSGQSFSLVSPSAFPVTIVAGGTYSLNVQFNPVAAGTATGQLTIASNSSTSGTAVISLSGTGTAAPAALSALSCSSGAMTGSGTDACTVTLTAAAPSGGLIANLSSSSLAVTVPNTVTIPAGATSAGFTATVSSVATAQAATMTASTSEMFTSFTLQLNAAILALSINATSVAFGDVLVNTPTTQSVTLTSTGNVPVTVSGATLTGAGFTLPGAALPATLSPGQETALNIEFDPTNPGAATGQLTIASNSSTNGTSAIALTGTGTAVPVVAVSVTPTTASVTTGSTQQFTASVTGTSNTAVTWTVSGTGCSGAICGGISSAGLYTAPAAVPSPATMTITATSASDTTKSASASATVLPPGATYYLAPASAGGNDSNNGLSPAAPWLTPNHSVKCGDVIIAAPSAIYAAVDFNYNWGAVSCPSGNNVAWLTCATFDGCKISGMASLQNGMAIGTSYWGVQGWEVDGTTISGPCLLAYPMGKTQVTIHHIIFANNVLTGCGGGGIIFEPATLSKPTTAGTDYIAVVGNIDYNTAGGSSYCAQGISIYEPVQQDTLPGTHIFIAGNFSWGNVEANPCGGGPPTDGEGIILDTLNGCQTSLPAPYTQQIVVEDNITIFNGARGIGVLGGCSGVVNPLAHVYFKNDTAYGNNGDNNQNLKWCGEITLQGTSYTDVSYSIGATAAATGCGGNPIFGISILDSNSSDQIFDDLAYSATSGQSTDSYNSGTFAFGPSVSTVTNPNFANPVNPGAPNCSTNSSVPACMAQVIANFTPTNSVATGFGYQPPSTAMVYDPLFPQWLCNVNLPAGLVSMGCESEP